ncbi:MAG: MFS transporter [Rubrobacteraceae bacterium]
MAERGTADRSLRGTQRGVGLPAVVSLLLGTLGISLAYGMLLLLPLYVQELGGNEASFGVVLSSAAVPAVVCIGLLIRFPETFRPHWVVAVAIGIYGLGTAGTFLVGGTWTPLIGIGVLLGTAWAVVYTVTPMVMSEMVTDEGRATYFGYLTGTQQVGIGAGPVLAGLLVGSGLGYEETFLTAGIICAAAVVFTVAVAFITPDRRVDREVEGPAGDLGTEINREEVSAGEALRKMAGSEAVYYLIIVLLFACLFTSMTQFQTTFAAAQDLDYSVFYITYTVAVIASRFGLASWASRFDPSLVIAVSVSVMALAVASFLLIGSSLLAYGIASAFVGLGYGLALPTAQAQAVNVSEELVRPRVLPVAGLVFQGAILAFPLVAGWIIAGFGYGTLFIVLVSFALIQAVIGWWRFMGARNSGPVGGKTTG